VDKVKERAGTRNVRFQVEKRFSSRRIPEETESLYGADLEAMHVPGAISYFYPAQNDTHMRVVDCVE
jgi:hypothetical protein